MKFNQSVFSFFGYCLVMFFYFLGLLVGFLVGKSCNIKKEPKIKGTFIVADLQLHYSHIIEPEIELGLLDESKRIINYTIPKKEASFIRLGDTIRIDSLSQIYFMTNRKFKRFDQ
jgi:hypothetical protein